MNANTFIVDLQFETIETWRKQACQAARQFLCDHDDAAVRATQRDASGIVSCVATSHKHRKALLEHEKHASILFVLFLACANASLRA